MNKALKNKKTKAVEVPPVLTLEEATSFLKKAGEWESVVNFDRDIIINWASFLKARENKS